MRRSTHYNGTTFSYQQRSPHGQPLKLACVIPWRTDLLGTHGQGVDHAMNEKMQGYAQRFVKNLDGFQGKNWKLSSANTGATSTGAPAVLVEVAER